jgi:hypothetical protein
MASPCDALRRVRRLAGLLACRGRHERGGWRDPHSWQVEPVCVPADADRRIGADHAVGVTGAGLLQQAELVVVQRQELPEAAGERSAALSVLGIVAVVQPHRVVEEREQERDVGIGAVGLGGEVKPVPTDPLPVREPVQMGSVGGRARDQRAEHVLDRSERQRQIYFPRRCRCDWKRSRLRTLAS